MFGNKNRSLWATLEIGLDIIINLGAVVMAYILTLTILKSPENVFLESPKTVLAIFSVVIVQSFISMLFRLYDMQRLRHVYRYLRIVMINLPYYTIVLVITQLVLSEEKLRFVFIWVVLAMLISCGLLFFKLSIILRILKFIKKRNFSLRKVILVGDNTATVEEFVKQATNDEHGMMIIGYVGDKIHPVVGCEKLGSFKDLSRILDEYKPTDVVFAIDSYDKRHLIKLVNLCDDRCIKVYFLPVIYGFFKSARQIEPVGTMPVINAHSTPLDDKINAALKRVMDILGSLALIVLTSPVMIAAAIGVYLSSPGPVLFRQERIGKMGKSFTMLKFRSMKVNVKSDCGWSNEEDDRKTKFGAFIRRTSIDELPQLFNVLFGHMSLVGPRPEVPYYVNYFRDTVPLYMVKHYVKPGITGLAQVRGLRGDTSIEDRIHADIEYIENWSFGLDIAILLRTPLKAINKQERYVEPSKEERSAPCEPVAADTVAEQLSITPEIFVTDIQEDVVSINKEENTPRGKILYAASTMSHIDNFHLGYIERLRSEGYTVKVMARGDGADYNIPFSKKMFSASNTACRAEIKKIVEREGFDTIVLNTSLAAFHIRFALNKKNRPRVVNIVHGYLFSKNVPLVRRTLLLIAEKLVASRTDCIIVMNEQDLNIATRHKLTDGDILFTRGMGASVRPQLTRPEVIRREMLSQDKFVMAFVGELSARKNQEFLISSLNDVKEYIPEAELWLVGDGPGEEQLKSLARDIDLSESVRFLGKREDACDIMRACDLYVSASTIEGMPFNIIEAMGCKKTILASAVKGHTDLIEDGRSGFLFKYGDRREFVDKAVKIYKGEYKLSPDDIYARYCDFDNEKVFNNTYEIIKDAIENE